MKKTLKCLVSSALVVIAFATPQITKCMEEDDSKHQGHSLSASRFSQIDYPPVARGHEEIYQKLWNGKLVYKPNKDNDIGKIELRISDLTNPLEGTFDLSQCGDSGKYLSISTGYRKEKKEENSRKAEIWLTPRFLVEKELETTGRHFNGIFPANWPETASFGILWTWSNWNMDWYEYLTNQTIGEIADNNILQKWKKSQAHNIPYFCPGVLTAIPRDETNIHPAERFMFIL